MNTLEMFDVTKIASNIEAAQKQFFDNAASVLKTTRGLSAGNLKTAREMDNADKIEPVLANAETVVNTIYGMAENNLHAIKMMTNSFNGQVARASKTK